MLYLTMRSYEICKKYFIEGKVILLKIYMCQKGTTLDHDFYVVVGKQCRIENAYAGHQHNISI